MGNGEPILMSLFVYAPNKVAPIFFTIAYAISAAGHIWQCYRYKCIKVIGLHPVCAVLFTAGYALREYGAFNYLYSTQNLIVFVLSQVFIYVSPPLLELANYHVLGRLFYYVPYFAPFAPGKVLRIFGGLMAVVELLNSLGVSLSSNPSSSHATQELGSHLTIAALAMQLGAIIIFIILAIVFHRRCTRGNIRAKAVLTPLTTLYVSMSLIFIRCIYRLVEHLGATTVDLNDLESLRKLSPILRYEWYFYIFEATLMLINSAIWNVWNPGRFLPRDYHVYLARDGRTEVLANYKADSRPLLLKVLSFLTFGLLFRHKMQDQPFEELSQYPDDNRGASPN